MNREIAIAALKRWQSQIADEFGSKVLNEAIDHFIKKQRQRITKSNPRSD